MAIEVLDSGDLPFNKKWAKFLPDLEKLQCGTDYAKKIGMLPAFLFSALGEIQQHNDCTLEDDGFGWKILVTPFNERLSITVAIVDTEAKAICTYKRGDNVQDQVDLDGLDLIGSRAYGANSIDEKLPPEFWQLRIKNAKFADKVAWEKTDETYSRVIMPVLLIELEKSALCAVRYDAIENPTSKMQVAINQISREQVE